MKKIYVEITNNCNLDCSFCIKNTRSKKFMSYEEFDIILKKIKPYTNYIYLHVLGEPMLHPKINDFIKRAEEDFYVNITTNGYLINRLNTNVRQINISLHSYSPKYKVSIEDYLKNIFFVVDKLPDTYISYRFWVDNPYSNKMLSIINEHYNTDYNISNLGKSNKLKDNVFINTYHEFSWPDVNNKENFTTGKCYALKDHIGILVDGTIVPCCLDSKGDIPLGNIFTDSIDKVLKSERVTNMLEGFKRSEKREKLCQKCKFM